MTARHAIATFAHWVAITLLAFLATAFIPFNGPYAAAFAVIAAAGVAFIGLAIAPPRKDRA